MDGKGEIFAIFENYLASGSPGKSADKPVVIYAANYTLLLSERPAVPQRPSEKRHTDPTALLVT